MIWCILSVILLWLAVVMVSGLIWSLIEGYKREAKEDEAWVSILDLYKDKEK
jgi:hypothetical protein